MDRDAQIAFAISWQAGLQQTDTDHGTAQNQSQSSSEGDAHAKAGKAAWTDHNADAIYGVKLDLSALEKVVQKRSQASVLPVKSSLIAH
ncbi:MAG: hypothetical protein AAGJ32_00930 [Pseudomonadota bacterium]